MILRGWLEATARVVAEQIMAGTAKATVMAALGTLLGFEGSTLAGERSLAPSNRPVSGPRLWILSGLGTSNPCCLIASVLLHSPDPPILSWLIVSILRLIDGYPRTRLSQFYLPGPTGVQSHGRKWEFRILRPGRRQCPRIMGPINNLAYPTRNYNSRKRRTLYAYGDDNLQRTRA